MIKWNEFNYGFHIGSSIASYGELNVSNETTYSALLRDL